MSKKNTSQKTNKHADAKTSVELNEEDLDQAQGAGVSTASATKVSKATPKTTAAESRIRSNLAVP